jgi:hypothetical protein
MTVLAELVRERVKASLSTFAFQVRGVCYVTDRDEKGPPARRT